MFPKRRETHGRYLVYISETYFSTLLLLVFWTVEMMMIRLSSARYCKHRPAAIVVFPAPVDAQMRHPLGIYVTLCVAFLELVAYVFGSSIMNGFSLTTLDEYCRARI
jgi:hypothetical protein